jgi:2,4-didehydro-3-deoxy-L-rhamnonate hydrolase
LAFHALCCICLKTLTKNGLKAAWSGLLSGIFAVRSKAIKLGRLIMRLCRIGPKGKEKTAIIAADGTYRDLSGHVPLLAGEAVGLKALDKIRKIRAERLDIIEPVKRYGSCLATVPNFYCIGLNYAKHAAESGMQPPSEPVLFSKAASTVHGPYDDVIIPKNSMKTDWEVELGVIIGAACEHVSEKDALTHVAGYCVINDLSEREFQIERGGQWIKGKSAPTFGPIGPYLVTADEVPNPQDLPLSLKLNGVTVQDSTTADMIFSVAEIISYMSRFMRLVPGDIITTGTPAGVGMGMKPQRFLTSGDVMELTVEGLGHQKQIARAYSGA